MEKEAESSIERNSDLGSDAVRAKKSAGTEKDRIATGKKDIGTGTGTTDIASVTKDIEIVMTGASDTEIEIMSTQSTDQSAKIADAARVEAPYPLTAIEDPHSIEKETTSIQKTGQSTGIIDAAQVQAPALLTVENSIENAVTPGMTIVTSANLENDLELDIPSITDTISLSPPSGTSHQSLDNALKENSNLAGDISLPDLDPAAHLDARSRWSAG